MSPGGVPLSGDAAEDAARIEWAKQMKVLNDAGNWEAMQQRGIEWQKLHPTDPNGWSVQARGAFLSGDVKTAIAAWEKSIEIEPGLEEFASGWLKMARDIEKNFPDIKLQPLQFEPGDAVREGQVWSQKASQLLNARAYDEIEKVVAQLEKSNSANSKGSPFLSLFFGGLGTEGGKVAVRQAQIAAWRAARPKSNLARLAAIQLWTDAAWEARGTGFANTITPAMEARVQEALVRASKSLEVLPESAYYSPLAFEVALEWGHLAGVGRSFLDSMFKDGTELFPNYLPLYRIRANSLLPRWYGEAGEWESMAKKRAGQLGGETGDIFYGRMVWFVTGIVGNLPA